MPKGIIPKRIAEILGLPEPPDLPDTGEVVEDIREITEELKGAPKIISDKFIEADEDFREIDKTIRRSRLGRRRKKK